VRYALPVVLLTLAGCSSTPELPVQPPAPTKADAVTTLGKDLDKTDHRVGAALVAIERNADKPKVVVAESRLAQSYLPVPPEQDVAFSMARAAKGSEIDYAKQMAFGRTLATAVNKAWERLEADQSEAKRVSDLKDKRIAELTQEVIRVKKEASNNAWTWIAGGLAVAGALATSFLGPKIGLPLLLCGMLCGAVPFIYDSEYFAITAGTTIAASCGLGLWWLYDRVKDSVNENEKTEDKN